MILGMKWQGSYQFTYRNNVYVYIYINAYIYICIYIYVYRYSHILISVCVYIYILYRSILMVCNCTFCMCSNISGWVCGWVLRQGPVSWCRSRAHSSGGPLFPICRCRWWGLMGLDWFFWSLPQPATKFGTRQHLFICFPCIFSIYKHKHVV